MPGSGVRSPLLVYVLLIAAAVTVVGCKKRSDTDSPPPSSGDPTVSRITTIKNGGGRLDWSRGNLIAFDQLGSDLYYDVFTMNPDGSGETCLTCGKTDLPGRHIGNPAWHPSNDYLAIQVQKAAAPTNIVADFFASPGSGVNNDLWIMNRQGTRFWQITNVPLQDGGVLHPHFSVQGDKLLWSERLSAQGGSTGQWALKLADFRIADGVPSVTNVRQFQPGPQHQFYESHGFTPDGTKIIFSGNLETGQDQTNQDVYTLDIASGALVNLTNTPTHWDEHAQIMPSGDWIVWMSSMGPGGANTAGRVNTDYWIMRVDGSGKRQLTSFNVTGAPEYISGGVTAADCSWNPDGTRLMTYLILDTLTGASRTVLLEFSRASSTDDPGNADPDSPPAAALPNAPSARRPAAATAATQTRIVASRDDPRALSRANDLVDGLLHDRTLQLLDAGDDPLLPQQSRDRFVQMHQGLRVRGGSVVRQRHGSRPLLLLGTVYSDIDVDVVPALTESDAAERLVAQVRDPLLVQPTVQDLLVLPIEGGGYALAYQLRGVSVREIFTAFVDAHSGALLKSESLNHAWPDQPAGTATAAIAGSPARPYDMRKTLENTLQAVARPAQSTWLTSFGAAESDDHAARVGRAMGSAVSYVQSRLTSDPALSGRLPVTLVHPQEPGLGSLPFGVAPVYSTGGIVVFPDGTGESEGRITAGVAGHYLGHALTESTSGLLYSGESAAVAEALADLVGWGASGAPLNLRTAAPIAGRPTVAGAATFDGTAISRTASFAADPVAGGRVIFAVLGTALDGDGANTPARRAAIETAFLHALTWLTPADTTLDMARAATIEGLRNLGAAGEAPRARLRKAWDRAGVR